MRWQMGAALGLFYTVGLVSSVNASPACFSQHLGTTLVKSADDAIKIAFAEWHAANSEFKVDNEHNWAEGFSATLHGCVWEVAEKPTPPHKYSTFVLKVDARDGKFLGAEISD